MNKVTEVLMYFVSITILVSISIPIYRVNKFNSGVTSGLAIVMFLFFIPFHPKIINILAKQINKNSVPRLRYAPLIPLIAFFVLFGFGYTKELYFAGISSIISVFIMLYISLVIKRAKEL